MTTTPTHDAPWSTIHRDFKTTIDGKRFVLALDQKTGATVLRPYIAPPGKALGNAP